MVISTEHFSYNHKSDTFVQEVSLLPRFRWSKLKGNNLGLTIMSHKTAAKVDFVVFKTDGIEDIEGWWLRPTDYEIKKNPKLLNVKMLIIND